MIRTSIVVLAMVLAITLVVTTPALGSHSEKHQFAHGGEVFVTDNGLVQKMDVAAGNCRDLGTDDFPRGMYSESDFEKIVSLCEKKGFSVSGPPAHSQPHWKVTDNGVLVEASVERGFNDSLPWGKCSNLPWQELFNAPPSEQLHPQEAVRACEKAGFSVNVEPQTPLSKTGGPPLILVPIALLIISGLLIRKSTGL